MAATEQQMANRKRLIEALRDEMPKGFTWDFSEVYAKTSCGTVGCAMGLAMELGILSGIAHVYPCSDTVAGALGLSGDAAREIFAPGDYQAADDVFVRGYDLPWQNVTPQMVADKLEAA